MRNLKRVLSLALATVMLLGMMVIGAGAADAKAEAPKATAITDLDKVTNKEAVNLMVDLGIIVGKPDGTFAPTETVDRATMAKLIYFVLMGTTDEGSFKGVSTPLTDIKGNWAEGFINYCFSMKIVAGVGDNTFNPSGKVTVASAAKMLLVALGYDAKLSKYEGDAMWSVNIMRDAQKAGLLSGINQKSGDELTRDNAAQMIFNALFAKTVTPITDRDQGVQYLTKYEPTGSTLGTDSYKLVKVTGTVTGLTKDGKAEMNVTKPASFKTNVSGKVAAPSDILGKTGVIYVKATAVTTAGGVTYTFDKIYSTTVLAGASVVLGTSTNGTPIYDASEKDLITNKGANKSYLAELDTNDTANANVVTVYVDGTAVGGESGQNNLATPGKPVFVKAILDAVKVRGNIVELIDSNDNGKADIIKITTKAVYTLTADAATKVVDKDTQVKVPGVSPLANFTAANTTKNVKGFEGLVKGDVVLVNVSNDVYFIEKAPMVEGIVAGINASSDLKIDGTYYKTSGIARAHNEWAEASEQDWTNTYKFYLDNGKNIVKAVKVTNESVTGEYAVVLASQPVAGDLKVGTYGQVKLLLTDGTTVVGKLAKVDGVKPAFNATPAFTAGQPVNDLFYTYTVNSDGNYELTKVTKNVGATGTLIKNNTKLFDDVNIGSSNTVFIVELLDKNDSKTYKVYTGIENVPAISAITSGPVLKKDGLVTYAFVKAAADKVTGTASDAVFFYVPNTTKYTFVPKTTANPTAYYEYTAYLNGEKTTVKSSTLLSTADKVYKASTKTAEGVYTNADVHTEVADLFVTVANGGTLQVAKADGSAAVLYSYDGETQVYRINSNKELSVAELKVDATDTVTVIASADGKYAKTVFIRGVESADKAVTGIKVFLNGVDVTAKLTDGASTTAATLAHSNVTGSKIKDGDKITIGVTVSPEASYTVDISSYTVKKDDDTTLLATFKITVTSESGVEAAAADYVLTLTGVSAS